MYKKIEELYKKKSPYNKIKIKMFWTYIVISLFLSLFNIFNSYVLMILTVIMTIIRIKYINCKSWNDVANELYIDRTTAYKKVKSYLEKVSVNNV